MYVWCLHQLHQFSSCFSMSTCQRLCMLLQNNDYEKARRDQIRRNLERMQELNVVGAAAKVAPAKREKPPKARGLPARRRVKVRLCCSHAAWLKYMGNCSPAAAGPGSWIIQGLVCVTSHSDSEHPTCGAHAACVLGQHRMQRHETCSKHRISDR
jgi:hypothetical protein